GQQSRIHCTRLAGEKADRWFLRQHPAILGLPWRKGISRPDRDNAIDLCFQERLTPAEQQTWEAAFRDIPPWLSPEGKHDWLATMTGVSLSSDAFFPFRDSIDRAAQSGVKYVVEPGNSARDRDVIAACDEYGMVMAFSSTRFFHH
ncbi:MAG TPA: hypothetical protein VMW13_06490, partial [Dehalococcoidales bacterium]|nr:hypothetical protein [Dehalococcoidales bacterium]